MTLLTVLVAVLVTAEPEPIPEVAISKRPATGGCKPGASTAELESNAAIDASCLKVFSSFLMFSVGADGGPQVNLDVVNAKTVQPEVGKEYVLGAAKSGSMMDKKWSEELKKRPIIRATLGGIVLSPEKGQFWPAKGTVVFRQLKPMVVEFDLT